MPVAVALTRRDPTPGDVVTNLPGRLDGRVRTENMAEWKEARTYSAPDPVGGAVFSGGSRERTGAEPVNFTGGSGNEPPVQTRVSNCANQGVHCHQDEDGPHGMRNL